MKVTDCKWLPDTVSLNDYGGDYEKYFDYLYSVFCTDLIKYQPSYDGKKVGARKHPMVNQKHEGFYHLTHKDYQKSGFENRLFDSKRSARIHWIKPVIINCMCCENCCSNIKIWKEKKRIHIFFKEERYLVVLDDRKTYYVVVTAYYVEISHTFNKLMKRYEIAKSVQNRTP